jgi:SpoIID/LytB domain protein
MPDSVTGRRSGLLLVLVLLASLGAGPFTASADEVRTSGPVRLEADAASTFELDDGRRFLDTLELRIAPDGSTVLVNELHMDDYLAGVAEMPPRWPAEALKAQAVAARTYAWRSILRGTFEDRGLGYDICATVACQVFTGTAVVEESSRGERWRAATRETSGEVLLDEDGGPILARYFSSSGGRTVPNEVAFPESGPLPYLVAVDDPDDEVSPLHRWRVEFTREEFDDILSRGETLSAAVPVAGAERRGAILDPNAEVVVVSEDGEEVAVPAVEFREFVSRVAADRHPDRFPGPRPDGFGSMPTTLPSSRFELEVTDDAVIVAGRGWGHGVGMGQHGARGKALRGMGYDEILAGYYNGLTPQEHDEVPERVRVGLDVGEDLEVVADTSFRIVADGDAVAERTLGSWGIERVADGFRLVPPDGRDADLDVSRTVVGAGLSDADAHVVVEADVNKPVELSLRVADAAGDVVLERDLGVAEPGTHAATWRFQDAAGERVPGGEYRAALLGQDEQGNRAGAPAQLRVSDPPSSRGGPSLDGRTGVRLVAVVALVAAAGVASAALVRRRT